MKFTINKNDILDVLSKVQGLTGRKSSLAITENILIKAFGSEISISATDLETGFEGGYESEIESEGILVVNARKIFEIVREFPSDEILINEVENQWIEIRNQSVEYHLVGANPDDFPEIPQIQDVHYFNIDSSSFKKMIEKTVMITGASDDKRAHIIGIYLEKIDEDDEKIIRMVSTDGSRLTTVDYTYGKASELPVIQNIIIPKKGLIEVNKFLESAGTIQIGLKDNHFIIKKDAETIIIRLLEGEFPEYREIINRGKGHVINLNKQQFIMMLKRMSILTSDNYKGAIFNFKDDKLTITSTNPDIGESKEEMTISFEGESIEVAFNPRYFIETLGVIESEKVILNIVDEEKPCLIEGEEDKGFLSVIMPMRI
jgi:DNA polymerase-3 subunit beta